MNLLALGLVAASFPECLGMELAITVDHVSLADAQSLEGNLGRGADDGLMVEDPWDIVRKFLLYDVKVQNKILLLKKKKQRKKCLPISWVWGS